MKRANLDFLFSVSLQRSIRVLLLFAFLYMLFVCFELPFVFKNGFAPVEDQLLTQNSNTNNGVFGSKHFLLESEENRDDKDAPVRPLDEPYPKPGRKTEAISRLNFSADISESTLLKSAKEALEIGRKIRPEEYRDMARTFGLEFLSLGGPKRFSYSELKEATDNFSNEIGKGGFGVVHKGKLSDGRVVAVKSLKNVTGGDADFWAEVSIIARMHHLNLVRLWGFCVEKGSRILVYEYVPNGSLDKFLFQGAEKAPILDWNVRYRIALGVARAIAYLHEECLEWVLHCDIKRRIYLWGTIFAPKVSDFGLAKLRNKEDVMSVSRMRGTLGYIAPEWTQPHQMVTSKADVYSCGLVLLEIVSGSRNFEQVDSNVESDQWFFPRWAFEKVFDEMNVEDILDERMKEGYERGSTLR